MKQHMKVLKLSTIFTLFLVLTGLTSRLIIAEDVLNIEIINGYLNIQEALVSDNFIKVKESTKDFLSKSKTSSSVDLVKGSNELSNAKNIEDARKKFKSLSSILIKKYKNDLYNNLVIVYCPMAGAKWIQKKGKIRNPYMGKEMLECGEKI